MQFQTIVARCSFPGMKILFEPMQFGDQWRMVTVLKTKDSHDGKPCEIAMNHRMRKQDIEAFGKEGEVVRFVFDRINLHIRHETAEFFTFDGKMVFNPHNQITNEDVAEDRVRSGVM